MLLTEGAILGYKAHDLVLNMFPVSKERVMLLGSLVNFADLAFVSSESCPTYSTSSCIGPQVDTNYFKTHSEVVLCTSFGYMTCGPQSCTMAGSRESAGGSCPGSSGQTGHVRTGCRIPR